MLSLRLGALFAFTATLMLGADLAPSIASITRSQTIVEGRSLTLSVSVNGTTPFTYQWNKDGTAISGATSSSYLIDPVQISDEGSYTISVTNSVGTTESDPVLVAVTPATAPSLSYLPSGTSFVVGGSFHLSPSYSGSSPLTFVWKKDGVEIPGATNYYYSVSNATAEDAGSYTITISNFKGAVTSDPITVTATEPSAPVITSTLRDLTLDYGRSTWLSLGVTGTQPLTFNLYKDSTLLQTSSYDSYYLSSADQDDAGTYYYEVSNSVGSVTSDSFTITVNDLEPPTGGISSSNGTVSLVSGQSLYLSGYANGYGTITYQWSKDGVPIPDATNYYYSKEIVSPDDAGSYSLNIANEAGSYTTSAVVVAVNNVVAPVITQQPRSVTVRRSSSVSFDVGVAGTGPFTYAWTRDGTPLNSNSYSLYLSSASATEGSYQVTITNSAGSVTSDSATLTFWPSTAPVITQHPRSRDIDSGSSASFGVNYFSEPAPTFQWYKDDVAIPGATGSSFSVSGAASSDAGTYSVKLTNSVGSTTSRSAVLSVTPLAAPLITQHPPSFSLLPGQSGSLGVGLLNSNGTSYQWYKDGSAVSGATSNYLSLSGEPVAAGTYHVVVTNSVGSATSEDAVVTVDTNSTRPALTYQTGSFAVSTGSNAYFNINIASGATVKWKQNGVEIPSATSTYLYVQANATNLGAYTAEVTASTGTVTSRPMNLTLSDGASPPRIRSAPYSRTVGEGNNLSLSANVSGTPTLTYQWKKDGTNIPLANNSSLSISNFSSSNVGAYTLTVTNDYGTVTSPAAQLDLLADTAPIITSHPASFAISSTDAWVSLNVGTYSSSTVTYQWSKDGSLIAGATGNYYYPSGSDRTGSYTVTVTNSAGSVTSQPAIITVANIPTGPAVTTQPTDVTVYAGETATFSIIAEGTGTLSYQWRHNGTAITGATGTTCTVSASDATAGTYTVLVTDSAGTISSSAATLTVTPAEAPAITSHPSGVVAIASQSVTFSAAATGTPTPTLQWYHNGNAVTGANAATLTLTDVQTDHAGSYTMVATNAGGSATTREALLEVFSQELQAPVITTQPEDLSAAIGTNVTFRASASGFPAPTFEWFHNGNYLGTSGDGSYTLNNVQESDGGSYQVIARNRAGSATSRTATLTVLVVPTNASFSGEFAGGGQWVLYLDAEGVGTLLLTLPGRDQIIYREGIAVAADGSFQFGSDATTAADSADALAAFYFTGVVTGSISPSAATIAVPSLGISTTGTVASGESAYAGAYDVVPLGGGDAAIHMLTTATGSVLAVAVEPSGVSIGSGTVDPSGNVSLSSGTFTASGQLGNTGFSGTVNTPGNGSSTAGTPAAAGGIERLANLSTRVQIGSGASMTVGFVLDGSVAKQVLVRAVGPGLSKYGVPGVMTNPQLKVYRSETVQAENDDWFSSTNASQLATTAATVGAFTLGDDSLDAALLTQLNPGPYTVRVEDTNGGGGISLIEIYDANPTSSTTPRMSNLSARGPVGTGADVLVAGFVVHGNAPKRFLIRGVGPTLAAFGVPGTLADPQLTLVRSGGEVIATNQDWETGNSVATLTTVSATVGAFPLESGTTDAAILVYLAPGAYTAQVSGTGDTTGEALVEVYEVP